VRLWTLALLTLTVLLAGCPRASTGAASADARRDLYWTLVDRGTPEDTASWAVEGALGPEEESTERDLGDFDWEISEAGGTASGVPGSLVTGSLLKEEIDRTVSVHLDYVLGCYRGGQIRQAGLAGQVVVQFVIGQDGAVRSARTKSSTLGDWRVERCINAVFLEMLFPPPDGGGIVIVSYPFVFRPGA